MFVDAPYATMPAIIDASAGILKATQTEYSTKCVRTEVMMVWMTKNTVFV